MAAASEAAAVTTGNKPNDYEYVYLDCPCGDRIKLAKNVGGGCWKTDYNPEWLSDFLVLHGDCGGIKVLFTNE